MWKAGEIRASAHIAGVAKHVRNVLDNPVNVGVGIDKAQGLAEADLANDIKGVELKPASKITRRVRLAKILLRLFQICLGGRSNQRLVRHHGRHAEGGIHTAAELGVEGFVGGGE